MATIASLIAAFPGWLASIPAAAWSIIGSVVTGVFTLLGIRHTNRGHEKRLREQLTNDRELKRIDREHAMRRDVYLGATEAMSVACQAVSNLANQSILVDTALKAYFEKSHAIARAMLISTPATASLLLNFRGKVVEAVSILCTNRLPEGFVGQPDRINKAIDGRRSELEAANLKRQGAMGRGDGFEAAEQEAVADWLVAYIARRMEERIDLDREISERQNENLLYAMGAVRELERLAMDVCASMRTELQLPSDRDDLIALIEEAGKRAEATLKGSIDRAKAREAEIDGV